MPILSLSEAQAKVLTYLVDGCILRRQHKSGVGKFKEPTFMVMDKDGRFLMPVYLRTMRSLVIKGLLTWHGSLTYEVTPRGLLLSEWYRLERMS